MNPSNFGPLKEDKKERAQLREERKLFPEDVKKVVKNAIEEKAMQNGHITYKSFAKIILNEREEKLVGCIQFTMDAAVQKMEEAMRKSTNTAARIMQPRNPGSGPNEHI